MDNNNGNFVIASGSSLSGKDAVVVDTSGRVGIGTIEPTEELQVTGDISASGTIKGGTLDAAAVSDTLAAAIVAEIDNDEIPIAKLAEDAITIAGTSTALGGSITSNAILVDGKDTVSGSFTTLSSSLAGRTTTVEGNVGQAVNTDSDVTFGDVSIGESLIHTGDTDTKIAFTTDVITMTAGNVEMLKLSETAIGDEVVINEGAADVNLRVESSNKAAMLFVDGGADKVSIGAAGAGVPPSTLTVTGDISASSGIHGGIVGSQITGSYDFPGAIVGYNAQGINVADASYNLTTSYAVVDNDINVCFVAPKSGIVEIEVQMYADGGGNGVGDLFFGLSDQNAIAGYNAVQSYYEVGVLGFPRFDHMEVIHKWVVTGLTAGTTYKYWLGAKVSSTTGTPTLKWGANTNNEFPPAIMKATALPSNTEIET